MNDREWQSRPILIVEDDGAVRENISLMLKAYGYREIDLADDAETALSKVAHKSFALILLDIGLPGMNGLELLEKIKSQFKDEIEVIMLTAWNETKYIIEATQKGAFYYVTKDKEVESLPTIVKRALEKREHNLMLHDLQSKLNEKVDAIENMLLTDENFYKDDLNIEYFNNTLLQKVFDSFPNAHAAGITDIKEKMHFWKKASSASGQYSNVQKKVCKECNDPQCFTFKHPIDESLYVLTDIKENRLAFQICQGLSRDIGIEKINSVIYVPLYAYVLDHLQSSDVDDLIKVVKEKKADKECIYCIWILFEAEYKYISKDQEKLFLSFFYKLGIALRYVYSLKENLRKHFELQQYHLEVQEYKKLELVTEGIPHDMIPLLSKLTDNINQDRSKHQEDSLRILRKVKALLDSYSDYRNSIKQSRYKSKPVDLWKAIQDAIATSYTKAESENAEIKNAEIKIEFKTEKPREHYFLEGDEDQLERAIRNLIINAKEAIFEAVKRGKRKDGVIEIILDKKGLDYEIIIRDNGIGFPKEKLDKPFEDFFSTKREGIGLGLNIAFEAFKRHGGKIIIDKEFEKGAALHCILPLKLASAQNG